MAGQPGFQYPYPGEDQGSVNKNFGDNIQFFRDIIGNIGVETTLTLAKITTNGKDGSITINQYGIVTGLIAPT